MRNDTDYSFSLTLTESNLQLHVQRFGGREALNQPFRFDLDLLGLTPPIDLDIILGQQAFLHLSAESGVHGIIASVSLTSHSRQCVGYRLTLVPYLQRLEQSPRRRVFGRLSAVQVLQHLLEEHQLPTHSYRFELPHGHYPCRPFCVQYDESDLELLQRLCEEEGIHYHFEHAPTGHVLVFAEEATSFPDQPVGLNLHQEEGQPAVERLYQRHHLTPPLLPANARDRALAGVSETSAANHPFTPTLEAAWTNVAQAQQAGRRTLERLRCTQREIHGQSSQPTLRSASIVQIGGHPISTFNDQWLISEIKHRGRQPSILEAPSSSPASQHYRNRFLAIPWSTVFRPALKHPKPRIAGSHLAYVHGQHGHDQVNVSLWTPEGEVITLPLSRLTLHDCQAPPAGSLVLVTFLDGDPDRPVLCPGIFSLPGSGAGDLGGSIVGPSTPPCRDAGLLLDWLLNRPDPIA
ncbi:type VI secretion system tip protein VgrG [Pseudomonas sp. Z1-29]|uniref:type VI secretion system Vgr family protein n=1 Tax=Pseudomonas sp. Z1-29 TaxID=2817410 RepID=UPI003DA816A4